MQIACLLMKKLNIKHMCYMEMPDMRGRNHQPTHAADPFLP
jgi:hypothetical protein